ncbi:hypothetical protein D623_10000378 [Myotis brandtii]|uniref:Uncharacterized protein n=1 Tax=Myotis brandtii TaxID=109478 RepID=S7QGT9_MYOBR|nr:hypothetical protein D623_10000378 [Myotis brandtii]
MASSAEVNFDEHDSEGQTQRPARKAGQEEPGSIGQHNGRPRATVSCGRQLRGNLSLSSC